MNFFKKYPKEVYILWLVSFITGIELIGAFLIPFFKDWGGLSQLQIQLLQSWFAFSIFFLEIPTGLIGDVQGKKFSVAMGFLITAIGALVYGSIPDMRVFIIAEFIFAVGVAFLSGADEALLYDITKENKVENEYGRISTINSNLHLAGMLFASLFAGLFIKILPVNRIFQLGAIVNGIGFLMILLFIKEPQIRSKKELIPDYKTVFKRALKTLRESRQLRKLVGFVTVGSLVGYFTLWFYQVKMLDVSIGEEYFGLYRVALLLSQIILSYFLIELLERTDKKRFILIGAILFLASGYVSAVLFDNFLGPLIFVVFAGGIGLKFRVVFSKFLNIHINSAERATTLSFISMFRRILLAVLNPVFGALVDLNLNFTLIFLAIIVIIGGLGFLPKNKELGVCNLD